MTITEHEYFQIRSGLLSRLEEIESLERQYMEFLTQAVLDAADRIYEDFAQPAKLLPFWANYPPLQRGHKPSGTSVPWSEVGEKAAGANIIRTLTLMDPAIVYTGLPLGGDIRFLRGNALVHFDIKMTGPNDNPDEVVASPHQISGSGLHWNDNGVLNPPWTVQGTRASMEFQPELPPFYVLDGRTLLCLTYFVKVVYTVTGLGDQPLSYLELVCVPNGLLLFDGPVYARVIGLLIPGKDIVTHRKKRTRVRLEPLAELAPWRCTKMMLIDGSWQLVARREPDITRQSRAF